MGVNGTLKGLPPLPQKRESFVQRRLDPRLRGDDSFTSYSSLVKLKT